MYPDSLDKAASQNYSFDACLLRDCVYGKWKTHVALSDVLGMSVLQTPALLKALGTPSLKLRGALQCFRCKRVEDVHLGQPDDPPLWWSLVQVGAAQQTQGQSAGSPS